MGAHGPASVSERRQLEESPCLSLKPWHSEKVVSDHAIHPILRGLGVPMDWRRIRTVLLIGVTLFVGIKFAGVYVNYLQLKTVMDSEALDARRTNATADEVEAHIMSRINDTSAYIPDDLTIDVEGTEDPREDIIVYAEYTEYVDLWVHEVVMDMSVEAIARPPVE